MTSFALLLGGNNGGGNGCDSSDFDYTLSWISFGFILFALAIVLISLILFELKFRKQQKVSNQVKIFEHRATIWMKVYYG